jgi:hypothetical protein
MLGYFMVSISHFVFLFDRVVYRSGDKIEVATESAIRGGGKVPGKMGRKKIQISRIGDERNRQVRRLNKQQIDLVKWYYMMMPYQVVGALSNLVYRWVQCFIHQICL